MHQNQARLIALCVVAICLAACASLQSDLREQEPAIAAQPLPPKPAAERQPETSGAANRLPWFGPHNVAEWATFGITLFAIIAAWRTLGILKAQTKAAELAAKAAQSSADIARDALHLTQGADIQFHQLIAPNPPTDATRVTLYFRNFGRTRALKAKLVWQHWVRTPSADIVPTNEGTHIVPPMGDLPVTSELTIGEITGNQCAAILAGALPFGFTATIQFEDIFGTAWTRHYQGVFQPGFGWVQGVTSETKTPAT